MIDRLVYLGLSLLPFLWISMRKRARTHLPPGPGGLPIFGNLLQVDPKRPFLQFYEWSKTYGSIYSLQMGPQTMIILNKAEIVEELFVKRGVTFSSRPVPHVAQDLMSQGQRMVFLPYSKFYKANRKCIQGATGPTQSKQKRSFQMQESCVFLYDLLHYQHDTTISITNGNGSDASLQVEGRIPESHWFSIFRRYTASIVMLVTYGKRVHKIVGNNELHKIYDVVETFTKVAQPGTYLADAFPILRRLPDFLAPWRKEGKRLHEWEIDLWSSLLTSIQQDISKGIKRHDCLVETYLRQRAESANGNLLSYPGVGMTEDEWLRDEALAYTAATVLEAGSEPTVGVMLTFVLFMLAYPDILKRVRMEVDSAVGMCMPTFEDLDEGKMPYLMACIKETIRRRPPVLTGIPHLADEDTYYQGYFIPKGSAMVGNVWTIQMDPERYPDPKAFNPDRFMNEIRTKDKWGSGPDSDRDHYIFGWGRRYCQGSLIAESSIFIVLARLVWGIDFHPAKDPLTGAPVLPDVMDDIGTYTDGFVSTPKLFDVQFEPRSEKHAAIITAAYEQTQHEWEALGLRKDER